ncbi:MAG: LysE family translocator [Jatrophihabitans sp.]|uniref:LysE family translocator n=1 Tax=Jatrophihabitans sp. TaxID=1932789 RepID=UPI003915AB61
MELLPALPAFLGAVLLIASVPGPAVALLIRRCTVGGFRAGVPVVLGLETGLYFWILAAGAGLAALVATSDVAYLVLRIGGTLVLVALGIQALRAARRGDHNAELPAARVLPRGDRGAFAMGVLTNAANPKAAVFTFAFYPQFIPAGYPMLPTAAALGLLQVTVEIAFYLAFAALIGRARTWFVRARVRRTLDTLCGTVLIGLGLRVATDVR